MMYRIFLLAALAGFISVSGQSVSDIVDFAYGEEGYGFKARAMGDAFVAVSDDYSALYWNPAGLGQIKNSYLFFEGNTGRFSTNSVFNGSETLDFSSYIYPKALGMVISLPVARGSLVFAGGYQQRKDFTDFSVFSGFNANSNGIGWYINDDTYYPFDRNVRQSERMMISGGFGEYVFAGSIALSPRLLVGVSLSYLKGEHNYSLEFLQEDIDNIYNVFPGDYDSYFLARQINSTLSGWSGKISFLLSFFRYMRIGGVVELPSTIHIGQTYSQRDRLVFDDGSADEGEYQPGEWAYDLYLPAVYSAGIAFRHPVLTLSVSGSYRQLNNASFSLPGDRDISGDYLDLYIENRNIRSTLHPSISLNAGFEFHPGSGWPKLRGGYGMKTSPYEPISDVPYMETYSAGIAFDVDSYVEFGFYYNITFRKRLSEDELTPGIVAENITRQNLGMGIKLIF